MTKKNDGRKIKTDKTRLLHTGRGGENHFGAVNPPTYHASTILYDSYDDMMNLRRPFHYGRAGNPTTRALEETLTELENGHNTLLLPSGLAACTLPLLALAQPGDHILVSDSVYNPTRSFCDTTLTRFGVTTEYFDPCCGADIEGLLRENTRLIFLESPGSLTMEMNDVPAICKIARAKNIVTVMDNTWATPLYFKPLDHGVDVSVQSLTKYVVGHADALMGSVSMTKELFTALKLTHRQIGYAVGGDDAALALRGLRTLSVRLEQHMKNALKIADWLETMPQVTQVLHPALPSHPQHALWQRDFNGASGLFSFVLPPSPPEALAAMMDEMTFFGMGFSWGGFESLMIHGLIIRDHADWPAPLIRLHIGLEDTDELIADLEAGLLRWEKAC